MINTGAKEKNQAPNSFFRIVDSRMRCLLKPQNDKIMTQVKKYQQRWAKEKKTVLQCAKLANTYIPKLNVTALLVFFVNRNYRIPFLDIIPIL